ncbi:HIRAN domain-containing protein [Isoptericola sp. AK164]|uniref:HIRAN domain-containing protein n=1 Tax=Isoptericola sp. AK164 TaxID=3024246 RepID=UPI002418558E|nr:HIRAN domain-containing protein [Isoptericola sp. AK164]
MEFVVVLILVSALLFWLAGRSSRRRRQDPASPVRTPEAAPTTGSPAAGKPPERETLTLGAFELWGSNFPDTEIVGEAYRRDSFRKLFKKHALASGQEYYGDAVLVPERNNPHDSQAVRVDVDEFEVGYLPREEAQRYRPVLDRLLQDGRAAVTPVRVWATNSDGTWRARVTIALGEPGEIVPANGRPDGEVVELPPNSRQVQVTGEEDHVEAIAPFARGTRTGVWVSLHGIEKPGTRTGKRVVEVRIDGQRCGMLSAVTSTDLLPVVDRLEAAGKVAAAHGYVRGNSLKADVSVDVMKAGDLSEDWIAENLS